MGGNAEKMEAAYSAPFPSFRGFFVIFVRNITGTKVIKVFNQAY